ncbi:50S ribosomal protein L35 [Candidatus Anaplasma sp. TIGMIC]|uniref:50S ribosomal protein L35 n=1 Tax=Candidatus Anaplasma sp. TIGMIC TaxID=3020713 RepID=UPI00232C08D8|nr:50S ribosomal protein L35 [Candidatus Anaplasma sp. TIGMIC]MDB1135786.1 50S ribosomal protein L35 [Candidatus Anaplasma sp. TIGMIC]
MPKLKTKSSAKKRFKVTASGKIVAAQSTKRHGMTKRSRRGLRTRRGTTLMSVSDARIVAPSIPYGL